MMVPAERATGHHSTGRRCHADGFNQLSLCHLDASADPRDGLYLQQQVRVGKADDADGRPIREGGLGEDVPFGCGEKSEVIIHIHMKAGHIDNVIKPAAARIAPRLEKAARNWAIGSLIAAPIWSTPT